MSCLHHLVSDYWDCEQKSRECAELVGRVVHEQLAVDQDEVFQKAMAQDESLSKLKQSISHLLLQVSRE